MARLNEVLAPAPESLEAIKRRFIRQNREIARVNSNQSIRIRNLEAEISRLLAENIAIREDAINARAEADKWRAAHRLTKEVLRIKDQFETKLGEMSSLVGELGALPEKIARRSSHKRRRDVSVSDLTKSSEGRDPRNRQTILEQEGRLPAILEDKCYPRKTLELDDVRVLRDNLVGDSLESPELGPPPVAHFDESEPLAFDTTRSPRRTSTELIDETEQLNRTGSNALENRRKRRTSSLLQTHLLEDAIPPNNGSGGVQSKAESTDQLPAPTAARPTPILKAGAKRKLEVSELEDTSKVNQDLDDFIFQRKSATATVPTTIRSSRFSRPPGRQNSENGQNERPPSPEKLAQPARRILAPKSTNSPAKRVPSIILDKSADDADKTKERRTERRTVSRVRTRPATSDVPPPTQPATEHAGLDTKLDKTAHQKIPASELDDVMSPTSAEAPMTLQRAKEMTIINSVEDVLSGSIGRGSRRARPAISYAPPKLNTKLRREGKELVSAVDGISKPINNQIPSHLRTTSLDINVENPRKIEPQPSSKTPENPSSDEHHQAQKEHCQNEPVSPSSRLRSPTRRLGLHAERTSEPVSRLSIYDPLESSPLPIECSQNQVPDSETVEIAGPTKLFQLSEATDLRIKKRSSLAIEAKHTEGATDAPNNLVKDHSRRSTSVSVLPNIAQRNSRRTVTQSHEADAEDIGGLRTRNSALTRRRSMMV